MAAGGIGGDAGEAVTKELGALKDDPAFREFFKLQEGFEWNGGFLFSFLRYCMLGREVEMGDGGAEGLGKLRLG